MKGWRFFLCLAALVAVLPASTHAKPVKWACASHADIIADELDVYTSPPSIITDGRISSKDYTSSLKAFKRDTRLFLDDCSSGDPNALYISAMLEAWHAWLKHYAGDDANVSAEYAEQLLTKCASTYFATPKGATCGTWQMKVIKWRQQWDAADAP